jgi:DNA-binding NtrC family response regulator
MSEKNIILYERYEGVRFVLERSLKMYQNEMQIFSAQDKDKVKALIDAESIDLLITELSSIHPDGLEITAYARKQIPDLAIIWITLLSCDVYRSIKEKFGSIYCIEKPLDIQTFRDDVLSIIQS